MHLQAKASPFCAGPVRRAPRCIKCPHASVHASHTQASSSDLEASTPSTSRREVLLGPQALILGSLIAAAASPVHSAKADDYTVTESGLRFYDVRAGEGASPVAGDTVVVHWAGYTKGKQLKQIRLLSILLTLALVAARMLGFAAWSLSLSATCTPMCIQVTKGSALTTPAPGTSHTSSSWGSIR